MQTENIEGHRWIKKWKKSYPMVFFNTNLLVSQLKISVYKKNKLSY